MRLIIDNNILFSLMKPDSTNSRLFSIMKVEFCAPEFIKKEFNKYKAECFSKSKISKSEFKIRKKEVFGKIKFSKFLEYEDLIEKSREIVKDTNDSPYIALALKLTAPIWSNDSLLKQQDKVKVLSTEEIIEILF